MHPQDVDVSLILVRIEWSEFRKPFSAGSPTAWQAPEIDESFVFMITIFVFRSPFLLVRFSTILSYLSRGREYVEGNFLTLSNGNRTQSVKRLKQDPLLFYPAWIQQDRKHTSFVWRKLDEIATKIKIGVTMTHMRQDVVKWFISSRLEMHCLKLFIHIFSY